MKLQVGVKALIKNSSDKYLLLQRSKPMDGEHDLSWDIPGGRIKPGETLHDALIRELREEISFSALADPVLIAAQDIFVKSKGLHVVRLTFQLRCDIETIKLSGEHTDYRWVSSHEAKKMQLEPYLKEVLTNFS